MGQFVRGAMRYVEALDIQQWLLVLVAAVVVGFFCMRGFGSRSQY